MRRPARAITALISAGFVLLCQFYCVCAAQALFAPKTHASGAQETCHMPAGHHCHHNSKPSDSAPDSSTCPHCTPQAKVPAGAGSIVTAPAPLDFSAFAVPLAFTARQTSDAFRYTLAPAETPRDSSLLRQHCALIS